MAYWKTQTSEKLKGFFEGFGFVFEVKEVPSTEKLTEEINALVTSDLSEFQSIFVFVLSHGIYDRICDVEGRSKEIQSLRKSLTDCHFLLDKPLMPSSILLQPIFFFSFKSTTGFVFAEKGE
jgi:hypothetical protein